MKNIFGIICLATSLLLTGCFEVEEKTTFKTATSGDYAVTLDMGKMMSQMKMFGGAEKIREFGAKDSLVYLADIIAQDTALTDAEKTAIKGGYMRMFVDEEKEEMKLMMSAPFTKVEAIGTIRNALYNLVASKSKMPVPGMENPMSNGSVSLVDLTSLGLSFKSEMGVITNQIVDSVAFKNRVDTSSLLQQVRQMAPLMGTPIVYKSVFTFHKPVKSLVAAKGTISDDRRTVIIKNELNDLFENPRAFEYAITY